VSDHGLRGLFATLRRLITGRGPGPPGPRRTPGTGPTTPGTGAGAGLPTSWQMSARPSAQLRWKRDLWGLAPGPRTAPRVRTIQRQRLLALAALVTIATVGAVYAADALVDRTLPARVRGVWQTDGPRYEQRLFELAGSRLAFQVSDSNVTIHQVTRVRQTDGEAGTLYQVEYRDEGETYEFSFIYFAGPPEEIRFAHQPFMIWTRVTDRRRLMQEMFD